MRRCVVIFWSWILSLLCRWQRSAQGGALILFVFVLPIALGMMGLVLDGARSLYIKSRFDQALRAATLAATACSNAANRTGEARKFFAANFPAATFKATVTGPTVTVTGTTVHVQARAQCPTYFPNIMLNNDGAKTPSTMTVQGWYEATLPNLEVVFVVSTGLNNWGSSAIETNSALNATINTLSTSNAFFSSYFGLIPFANGVAVGDSNLCQQLTGNWLNPLYATYAPIAGFRYNPRVTSSGYTINQSWNQGWTQWQTWQPWSISYNRYETTINGVSTNSWALYENNQNIWPWSWYWAGGQAQAQLPITLNSSAYKGSYNTYPMLMARNTWPYETPGNEASDAYAMNWTPFYIYGYNPQPMASLRSNASDIQNRIATALQPWSNTPNGSNMPNLGMIWASRMLSPSWRGRWVDNPNGSEVSALPANNNGTTHKVIVLISSGLTSISPQVISSAAPAQGGTTNPLNYLPPNNQLQKLMNQWYQLKLFKGWGIGLSMVDGPSGSNVPVNTMIPGSVCGGGIYPDCNAMLQGQYNNYLSQIQNQFSQSLIDQVLFNNTLRYLWASYVSTQPSTGGTSNIPPLFPDENGYPDNWNNILFDRNSLVTAVRADNTIWNGDHLIKFYFGGENEPYMFSTPILGSIIMINMMDYYIKILYHKDSNGAFWPGNYQTDCQTYQNYHNLENQIYHLGDYTIVPWYYARYGTDWY